MWYPYRCNSFHSRLWPVKFKNNVLNEVDILTAFTVAVVPHRVKPEWILLSSYSNASFDITHLFVMSLVRANKIQICLNLCTVSNKFLTLLKCRNIRVSKAHELWLVWASSTCQYQSRNNQVKNSKWHRSQHRPILQFWCVFSEIKFINRYLKSTISKQIPHLTFILDPPFPHWLQRNQFEPLGAKFIFCSKHQRIGQSWIG
jgi:hypothetical protein